MITCGKHTYMGIAQQRFNPVVEIGNFSSIASGVIFYGTCEHPYVFNRRAVSNFPFKERGWGEYTPCGSKGRIVIGNDVWVGEDVRVMSGVNIGDGAIIGAGAVIAKNITPYAVVVGNPGRVIKYRFTPTQIKKLLRAKWWNKNDQRIKQLLPLMIDIERFLEAL